MFFNAEKSQQKMVVIVGTTSALKIAAVQAVFEDATVIGVKTSSGVPEQPRETETETGAYNRLNEAKRLRPGADMYVGIENGIFYDNGNHVDKAIVIIENKVGEQQSACSKGLVFPEAFFLEAQHIGFDKVTVGQVMFEAGMIQKKDDPHADLGDKKSRVVFLTDTLSKALDQLHFENPKTTHPH